MATVVQEKKPKRPMFQAHSLKVGDAVTNAAELSSRDVIFPLFLVTILYFLWGFAYGLLDTLNKHFQVTLNITRTRSSGLQAAYFGAYLPAALGYANWILRRYGYRATFILGLLLFGIGCLMMWPAGLKRSFELFCAANFVIGSGLACLETAANPYMAVTGPPKHAELRINLAQAVQGIGTVVGPILGSYVFFKHTSDSVDALKNVQWVYLAVAIFVFLLAVVFFFAVIPEVTDADMALQLDNVDVDGATGEKPFRKQYKVFHAAFANFCYVGAQVAIASYFINYITETRGATSSALGAQFLAIAQGCFTIGRFIGSALMKYFKPRIIFLIYMTGVIIFIAASIGARGNAGLAMLNLCLFFESILFATFVSLGIRGVGKHTKRASGFIVAGVGGAAVVPPILAFCADQRNDTAFAMLVPTIFHGVAATYPIACNFVASYRDVIDATSNNPPAQTHSDNSSEKEKGDIQEVEKKG